MGFRTDLVTDSQSTVLSALFIHMLEHSQGDGQRTQVQSPSVSARVSTELVAWHTPNPTGSWHLARPSVSLIPGPHSRSQLSKKGVLRAEPPSATCAVLF